jgi:hypothetical protein
MTATEMRTVVLDDNTTIQIEMAKPEGRQEVADISLQFADFANVITGIATKLQSAIASVRPQEATLEFGIEAGIEAGKLTALLVQGTTKANVKVSLKWKERSSSDNASD